VKKINIINKRFSLNGNIFKNKQDLLAYAKTFNNDIYVFLSDWFNSCDFIVVKTSGSTGKPKNIRIKKTHMINSALATGHFFGLGENTKALLCLSPNFIAGKMMLVRALVLGWQLDVVKPCSHPLDISDKHYDFCAMVPMQAQNALTHLNRIKTLIIGGATVSDTLIKKIQLLKTKVYATYGMTETITHIALKLLNGNSENSYQVLPNVYISQDNRGCLVIEASKISDSKIITNDLVEIIDDKHFNWLGRFDNIINSGGVKISPEVVEKKLTAVLPFRFFITGLSDKSLGQKVALICEGQPRDLKKIKLEKYLSKYEIPKQFIFIAHFVETQNKKINRKKTLKLVHL
jgi:o-succinylbenzoate---CoA ligase